MYLSTSTIKLQTILGGAVSTNALQYTCEFVDVAKADNTRRNYLVGGAQRSVSNDTTDVDVVDATSRTDITRVITRCAFYNADTASATVIVKKDDGGTETIQNRTVLATLETLHYCGDVDGGGYWYVTTANGSVKSDAGLRGPSSSTDNAVVRWDGTGGTVLQNSGVIADDSNNVSAIANLAWTGTTSATGTGNHTFAGPIVISGASAGQIVFPASQNASAGANTLDDYEEGTWTPALAGSGTAGSQTYATQRATYTKIGRMVQVACEINLTAKDGTTAGNLRITGLPFTVTGAMNVQMAAGESTNLDLNVAGAYYSISALANGGTTFIALSEQGDNNAVASLTDADFGNTSGVAIAGCYSV